MQTFFYVVVFATMLKFETTSAVFIRSSKSSPFNSSSHTNSFPLRNGKARHDGLRHKAFQCGIAKLEGIDRRGRIIGGSSMKSPIPWQASLQSGDEVGNWQHICGAALISQHHVLTASLGKVDIDEKSDHEQVFYIRDADITTHRQFGFVTEFGNDIAILKISDRNGKGATFNEHVQPICIPERPGAEKMISKRQKCYVSGWGSTKGPFHEDYSRTLHVGSISLHAQETCEKLYNRVEWSGNGNLLRRSSRVLHQTNYYGGSKRFEMDSMLCAGPLKGNVDSSRGDSGGPLACNVDGHYYLVGIVSWGDHFNAPGIYTRVSHYLQWINTEKLLLGPVYR